MRLICLSALLLGVAAASADPILLQDNYLGKPGNASWTLPYDGVVAQTSERNTMVTASWTGDDLFVPEGSEYQVSRLDWIGLVLNGPGAQWSSVDVVIYRGSPDEAGHPIADGSTPVASFTGLTMDSFAQRGSEELFNLDVYEGQVSFAPVTLTSGQYFYAVRVVGNGRGRHYIASTGNATDFGAGHMGVTQSNMFFTPSWTDISTVLRMPDTSGAQQAYATDFSYRVWGTIVPEPASLVLALFGALPLLRRR